MKQLNLIDKAFLLKRTPFFTALDLDLLLAIADKLEAVSMKAGQTVFHTQQEAQRLYLVAKGYVLINDDEGKRLARLAASQFFGDEAVFSDKPRAYEAICEGEVLLLTLSRTHLIAIISECPSVALGFLHEYASVMPFRSRNGRGES